MLPLWWPRSACVYCGARLRVDRAVSTTEVKRHRVHDPHWLACDSHASLVPHDPHLQPCYPNTMETIHVPHDASVCSKPLTPPHDRQTPIVTGKPSGRVSP